eukprot:SAG22_NODE_12866_length_426_cov_165.229358_1_plen_22_part_10
MFISFRRDVQIGVVFFFFTNLL